MMDSVRADKWLWAARFYKTRSLAAQALSGGKIRLNGSRVKPARSVRIGDELRISKAGYEYILHVTALSERRESAKIAQTLYKETEASLARRAALAEQHKLAVASVPHPERRPDKKARRQLRQLKW